MENQTFDIKSPGNQYHENVGEYNHDNGSYSNLSLENRNLLINQKLNVNELSFETYNSVNEIREALDRIFNREQVPDMTHYLSSKAPILLHSGPNG
jgi:hypothetical protein